MNAFDFSTRVTTDNYSNDTYTTDTGKSFIDSFLDEETKKETIWQIVAGTPLFTLGGALSTFGIGLVSATVISPFAGAFAGGSYLLVSTITNIFLKIRAPYHGYPPPILKLVIDIAITVFATYAAFTYLGSSLSLLQTTLLVGASLLGTVALGGTGVLVSMAVKKLIKDGYSTPSYMLPEGY